MTKSIRVRHILMSFMCAVALTIPTAVFTGTSNASAATITCGYAGMTRIATRKMKRMYVYVYAKTINGDDKLFCTIAVKKAGSKEKDKMSITYDRRGFIYARSTKGDIISLAYQVNNGLCADMTAKRKGAKWRKQLCA